jgi:hypothetical protein
MCYDTDKLETGQMNEFLSLNFLYKYLEENAINYKYLHQIANLFQKVRDKMHLEQKTDD